jgi:hypothetical protein
MAYIEHDAPIEGLNKITQKEGNAKKSIWAGLSIVTTEGGKATCINCAGGFCIAKEAEIWYTMLSGQAYSRCCRRHEEIEGVLIIR